MQEKGHVSGVNVGNYSPLSIVTYVITREYTLEKDLTCAVKVRNLLPVALLIIIIS